MIFVPAGDAEVAPTENISCCGVALARPEKWYGTKLALLSTASPKVLIRDTDRREVLPNGRVGPGVNRYLQRLVAA